MTDKLTQTGSQASPQFSCSLCQEIIIDGVNIAGCEFHSSTPSSELCYMKGNKCNDNPNCYYKQLQRKEQECEELKAELQASKDDHAYAVELEKDIDHYKQALDNITGLLQSILDPFEEDDKEQQLHYCKEITENILTILNEVKDADK